MLVGSIRGLIATRHLFETEPPRSSPLIPPEDFIMLSTRPVMIAGVTLLVATTLGACATRTQPITQARLATKSRVKNTDPATFKAQVAPLLAARCMGCHTPGGRGSRAVEIFDAAGQVNHANVAARISRIYSAVESGRMPPRGPKFTPDELAVLRTWAEAGARND